MVNMLVLSMQIFPVLTTVSNPVASSLLNDMVETLLNNNIVETEKWTTLLVQGRIKEAFVMNIFKAFFSNPHPNPST